MSSSDETVLQKKDGETVVTWREYEALRDHLKREIDHLVDTLDGDIDAVKTQLGHTDNMVNTFQTQVTDIQASMAQLEATVTRLIGQYELGNHQYADADSIGDNEEVVHEANQGRGHGVANRNHGFHPLGVLRPRQGAPQEDDVFGRPKFTIPKFVGKDAEEYLNWEMRIEALWRLHKYADDRKIHLATLELMSMLCHGGIMLSAYTMTTTWYLSSLGVR
jgi:hypothetical protein